MNWPYALIGLFSVADALIGGYVFFKNPLRPLNRVFFAFAFGMSLIGIGMVFLSVTHMIFFDRAIFLGGYLMIFGLVLLSMKFPADEPLHPAMWLIFLPLIALATLTPFGFIVKEIIFRSDGILEPVNGLGMSAFVIIIGAYIFLSTWEFWKRYKVLSGASRLQIQYLALGAGVFIFATFLFNILLPALGIFNLNMLGPVSSVVFVAATAYAIVRHHLLDIRVIIQRGAIYLGLATFIIGLYLVLVFAVGAWFHRIFDRQDAVFLGVGLLVVCTGIFMAPFLERYFRRATDRFFFKDRYNYPKALRSLSAILNQNMEAAKIIKQTSQALKDIFRTAEVRILIFGNHPDSTARIPWYSKVRAIAFRQDRTIVLANWAAGIEKDTGNHLRQEHGIEVITPIFLERRSLGVVILGPKKSGDPYRDEDVELLTTFSYQAAVALEKARLFEKLKNYSGILEERVRERTTELARLQEEQYQMMVDISHGLQTPLTAVKSELDFLKRRPDFHGHLDAFERSIDGISRFIYNLLNLARLEIKKNEFPKEFLDLSNLLHGLVEYFRVMAEEAGINFSTRIESDIYVSGSKDHLEEFVTNLTSNAFKYLDNRRDKEVIIVLRRIDSRAVLEVADNGCGIASEDLGKIFERFYRGKQADTEIAGTGLGLAIAKRIVENHRGTITIESELGQGTRAIVELPLLNA